MQNAKTLEDSLAAPYKTILLPYNPAIVLLGIYPNELKTCPHKNLQMDVYSSFIQNLEANQDVLAKTWKQPRYPSNVSSLTITNVALWWEMLIVEEPGGKRDWGYMGNLCTFPAVFLLI